MFLGVLTASGTEPAPAPREFRGVWVATVDNIDWPAKPSLSTAAQKASLLALLDRARAAGLNAVLLQVRPMCDALYQSPLEPWSSFLTGKQGRAPDPMWDPLAFAVAEAHKRGLELHAWMNPFRARHPAMTGEMAENHVARAHPDWVKSYGKFLWLDPGDLGAREHSLRVVLDVVQRYDVDGVHIDDYFYPYPVPDPGSPKGKKTVLEFPDGPSWKVYRDAGGSLNREDWRRQNVDRFIQEMYKRVKTAKPWVKVGISPFGIYRPGFPPEATTDFDQYKRLYADPKLWMEQGWCDYLAPQLYWKIDSPQPYAAILRWWTAHNPKGRYVWPGSFTSMVRPENKDWPISEIVGQIELARADAGASGQVHYSGVAFTKDEKGLVAALKAGPYCQLALVPGLNWLRGRKPTAPTVAVRNGVLRWSHARPDDIRFWTLYSCKEGRWALEGVLPGTTLELPMSGAADAEEVAVGAVDKYGQESSLAVLPLR